MGEVTTLALHCTGICINVLGTAVQGLQCTVQFSLELSTAANYINVYGSAGRREEVTTQVHCNINV